ncbi:hypothetical protein Daus18300_004458 [Diaporthe australafricana]|uniref:WIBG Mago-binding domain-containing protein n=1 Tax=Diaporthe australafricana TaxID=127596 RepID=A0ABR3X907_9PEZI
MPSQPTNAGIVTDESSGERHIPESVRADGSTRRAIKIKPGYRPPEDVEVYKNRTAEGFRTRATKGGVIGAEAAADDSAATSTAAANKNAKRREARKKAKAAEENGTAQESSGNSNGNARSGVGDQAKKDEGAADAALDPEAEREKKARNLKKKLKQARELQDKKEGGQALLPEQIAKVIKINELVRELAALGLDSEGEPIKKEGEEPDGGSEEKAPA